MFIWLSFSVFLSFSRSILSYTLFVHLIRMRFSTNSSTDHQFVNVCLVYKQKRNVCNVKEKFEIVLNSDFDYNFSSHKLRSSFFVLVYHWSSIVNAFYLQFLFAPTFYCKSNERYCLKQSPDVNKQSIEMMIAKPLQTNEMSDLWAFPNCWLKHSMSLK